MQRALAGITIRMLAIVACISGCTDNAAAPPLPEAPPPISANVANVVPVAAFAIAPRYPAPGDTVTVDGSFSHDADGQILRYRWDFGNGTTQLTGATARTVFRRAGTYPVSLTIVDDRGDSTSVTLVLTVSAAGAPSTAVHGSTSTLTLTQSTTTAGTVIAGTVTARTAANAVISGVPAAISATGTRVNITPATGTTNGSGALGFTVASTRSQSITVRAVADFTAITATQTLAIAASPVSAARSSVRLTKATMTSAADSALVEVTVRDTAGNAVSGASVALGSSVAGVELPSSGTTDADGRWIGTVRTGPLCNSTASTLTATAGGIPIASTVVLTSPASVAYGICDPALWFDASDAGTITVGGGNALTQWRDKSGFARHANATTGPIVTNNALGGRIALRFNGVDNVIPITDVVSNARHSIFVVERRRSGKNQNYMLGGTATGSRRNLHVGYRNGSTGTFAYFLDDLNSPVSAFTSIAAEPARTWAFRLTNTERSIRVNGASGATESITTNLDSWVGAGIGHYNGQFFDGDIAEVLLVRRAVTDTERATIEHALMAKWSIGALTRIAGDAQSATAGTSPGVAPRVRVTDDAGAGIPNAAVTFQVTAGGGRVSGGLTSTVTTDASGFAALPPNAWVVDAGSNQLTAWYSPTAGAGASVTFAATGTLPSGLLVRFDASDTTTLLLNNSCTGTIATNTQMVGCWLDRSGNAHHASQPITSDRPVVNTTGIGGRRTVGFTLTRENWLVVSAAPVRAARSFAKTIVVAAVTGATENGSNNFSSMLVAWQPWSTGMSVTGFPNASNLQNDHWPNTSGGNAIFPSINGVVSGTPFVGAVTTRYTSGTDFNGTAYLNGVAGTTLFGSDPSPGGDGDLRIGQGEVAPATSFRFRVDGRIGEIVAFNRALSDTERQQVERYLGWKWGIPVQ
jgi:hypothetical protein